MSGQKKRGNPSRRRKGLRLKCYWCEKPIRLMNPNRDQNGHFPKNGATREHLIPRSQGGGGGDNIVFACRRCNMERGSDTTWTKGCRTKKFIAAGARNGDRADAREGRSASRTLRDPSLVVETDLLLLKEGYHTR